jgi:probable rRNA maturation factor
MSLCFRNRQRVCPIDLRLFRRIVRHALDHHFKPETYELCFHFVEAKEMARVNEEFLDHIGPTDVITFDHRADRHGLHGEIFICPEVAVSQAKEFRTSWQEEIVRYAVHGLLHLQGHDDLAVGPRKKMKHEEERIVKELGKQFALARLQRARVK